jgi:hypothetical protein
MTPSELKQFYDLSGAFQTPATADLLKALRRATPSWMALEMTEMRFLGCTCEDLDWLPHHVDFPRAHELCFADKRQEAEAWLMHNARGPWTFTQHYDFATGEARLYMRFAFVHESDAVLFKTAWY